MGHHFVLDERRGERFDEAELAQVLENRGAPLREGGSESVAGLFEPAGGSRLDSGGLFRGEPSEVTGGVGNVELVAGPGTGQNRFRVDSGRAENFSEVRDVDVQVVDRVCFRGILVPYCGDDRVSRNGTVTVDQQQRQHCALLRSAQGHRLAVHGDL